MSKVKSDHPRREIDKFLKKQVSLKRNEVARSLISLGFTERKVGLLLNINERSAHAMKNLITKTPDGTRTIERKAIANFFTGTKTEQKHFLTACNQWLTHKEKAVKKAKVKEAQV